MPRNNHRAADRKVVGCGARWRRQYDSICGVTRDFLAVDFNAQPDHARLAALVQHDVVEGVPATRMLEGRPGLVEDPRRWYALNDIVLHKSGKARVIWLRVEVDGEEVASYAADGIVLSTPTGSTAYNLSVGGPVVVPGHASIVISPISAHALSIRPVVVPPDATIVVHADDDGTERLVTVDGQVGATLGTSETLMVRRAARSVILVRFPEMTFFTRMRKKLGWGLPPDYAGA